MFEPVYSFFLGTIPGYLHGTPPCKDYAQLYSGTYCIVLQFLSSLNSFWGKLNPFYASLDVFVIGRGVVSCRSCILISRESCCKFRLCIYSFPSSLCFINSTNLGFVVDYFVWFWLPMKFLYYIFLQICFFFSERMTPGYRMTQRLIASFFLTIDDICEVNDFEFK